MVTNRIETTTWIKLVLTALMILCLLPMPYGFYNLVRFISMIGFAILAISSYKSSQNVLAITFASLALMFQPFLKLALGRDIWNVIDVAVAVFLITIIVKNKEIRFS